MAAVGWIVLAMAAGPQDAADVQALIEALGDDDPAARDEAERALIKFGRGARAALERAAGSSADPERRDRARRLLRHPTFLPIPAELAEPLIRLGSADDARWLAAVEELLAADPAAAKSAIALWADRGPELARFRAGQMLSVLDRPAADGLAYGIVVSKPVSADAPSGVEIWINRSSGELALEENMGSHRIRVLERRRGRMTVGGGAGCGGPYRPVPVFLLPPGGARAAPRASFFSTRKTSSNGTSSTHHNYGPGRFEVWTEYGCGPDDESPRWTGKVESNRVEVEIE
jgi:hypothetical protein